MTTCIIPQMKKMKIKNYIFGDNQYMWVFFMFTEAVVSVFMPRCLLPGGLCKQYKATNMLHSKRFYVVS